MLIESDQMSFSDGLLELIKLLSTIYIHRCEKDIWKIINVC
jgi:hypothetical protein